MPVPFRQDDNQWRARAAAREWKGEGLQAEIGRLTSKGNWLKKIWHRSFREMSAWQ